MVKRMGQPAVLGEVLAGLLLGPSVLGLVQSTETIISLAEIGVVLLMFIAGLETDLHELKRTGVPATIIALGGVAMPLFLCPLVAYAFGLTLSEGIMLGTILTATSVSISVQTLLDMGYLRSLEGTTILGAAIIDDILGIIVLTLVIGVTGQGTGSLLGLILRMALFFLFIVALGRQFNAMVMRLALRVKLRESLLGITLAAVFLFAYLAEISGVAAVTGAYIFGALISRTNYKIRISERVGVISYAFFVPVFFASIGLRANLRTFNVQALSFSVALILVAVFTKIIGCGLTARITGFSWRQSLQIGVGMIPRAEVALVIASLALARRSISDATFASVVLLVVVTTILTPPLLKWSFKDV